MLKNFDEVFVEPGGKIQNCNSLRTIRANLARENDNYEAKWESKLGVDRLWEPKCGQFIPTHHKGYRDNLMYILHSGGRKDKHEKLALLRTWQNIECGHAPDYPVETPHDIRDAAGVTSLTAKELKTKLNEHFKKNPLPTITQCKDIRGRVLAFVLPDREVQFMGCINCQHNRKEPEIGVPDSDQQCKELGLSPIGEQFPIRRNEFSASVAKIIRARDQENCVAGRLLPGEICDGPTELAHVVSAWNTHHQLTERDGLCLCQKHNGPGGMYDKNLLDAFPDLKKWGQEHSINIRGREVS